LRLELGPTAHARCELAPIRRYSSAIFAAPAVSPRSIAAISFAMMFANRLLRSGEVREQRHEVANAVAHGVDEEQHDLIPRKRCDGDVELEIEIEQVRRAGGLLGFVGERTQLGEPVFVLAGASGSEPSELAAKDPTKLEEIADQLGLTAAERQQVLDELDAAGLHEVLDPCAVALANPHEALMFELLERFPQRRAIDTQAL